MYIVSSLKLKKPFAQHGYGVSFCSSNIDYMRKRLKAWRSSLPFVTVASFLFIDLSLLANTTRL
jgi:hypothetical protein